jgi:hypothetical protein
VCKKKKKVKSGQNKRKKGGQRLVNEVRGSGNDNSEKVKRKSG